MSPLRVLIVANDPLARAGLAALLDDHTDYEIVGQISEASSAADDLDIYGSDVILWDLGWAVSSEQTSTLLPTAEAVIVGLAPNDSMDVSHLFEAGLRGLLRRDATPEQLASGLQAAAAGLLTVDEAFFPLLSPSRSIDGSDGLTLKEDLTPREQEVLELLAEGLSNRAIAQALSISEHTVKFHDTAIMGKLEAQSRTDAVVRATRLGLIFL
jgi:two-component system nitrate/nitrite response regulator NarL